MNTLRLLTTMSKDLFAEADFICRREGSMGL